MQNKTGAWILVDFLKRQQVELVFGYPGGAILPVYDELFKTELRHILVRHEQAAIHAAEGYAKATGRLGVVLVTSGPGATNLITGLVDAQMDSVPILAITGQVPTYLMGKNSFQEVDVHAITKDVVKFSVVVRDVHDLEACLEEAYVQSVSGRPGASVVDVPKDVQNALLTGVPRVACRVRSRPDVRGDLLGLASAINAAERPLLYVGGGAVISGVHGELRLLAEGGNIPVAMTLMGLGAFPMGHELSLDMMGMHGTYAANMAVMQCDLLIALGARFDDRVTGKLESFAKQAKIAHVDIDPSEINKLVHVDYPILGDLKEVLEKLLPSIQYRERSAWHSFLHQLKKDHPLRYHASSEVIKPQHFIKELNKVCAPDTIICTEVGQHQMWAAQFYLYQEPRSWITSGGLGTMGFGFPAAIGAKLAYPEKEVVLLAGDASFQMNQQELATCSVYKIAVKVVILNNSFLGMVRQWQDIFFGARFAHTRYDANPDFVKLAGAYKLNALRISRPSEIAEALEFLLRARETVILDVVIPEDEMVFPMVPAGASLSDIIELDGVSSLQSDKNAL